MQLDELRRYAIDARRLAKTTAGKPQAESTEPSATVHESRSRLSAFAARVLQAASGIAEADAEPFDIHHPDESLWDSTVGVTTLRAQREDLSSIDEAVAALQLLSTTLAGSPATVPARIQ